MILFVLEYCWHTRALVSVSGRLMMKPAPTWLHQMARFSQSVSQSATTTSQSRRVRLCVVVATNSGTEGYESSLVCLLTEDTLSLLSISASLFFFSLCVSLSTLSLPSQLCFGVGRPFIPPPASVLLHSIFFLLNRGNNPGLLVGLNQKSKKDSYLISAVFFSCGYPCFHILFCLHIAVVFLQCTFVGRTPLSCF